MTEMSNINILNLDFSDPEICLQVLYNIKYTRLEGIVVENEFDQIFNRGFMEAGWHFFDNMVLKLKNTSGDEQIFVFPGDDGKSPDELMDKLADAGIPVRFVDVLHDNSTLVINYEDRRYPVTSRISSEELFKSSGISDETRFRINSIYWGLCRHMGERFLKYLKDIIIKDYFLTNKNMFIWDADRFYKAADGSFHYFEVKHKYPTRAGKFGMNVGEIENAGLMNKAGFKTWHIILAKPYWSRDISSMYLFSDRRAREKALWLVGNMGSDGFFENTVKLAPSDTSIYQNQSVKFRNINLDDLFLIGANSASYNELSHNLLSFLNNHHNLTRINNTILQNHRLSLDQEEK